MNLTDTFAGTPQWAPLSILTIYASKSLGLIPDMVMPCKVNLFGQSSGFKPAAQFDVITNPGQIEAALSDDAAPTHMDLWDALLPVKNLHGRTQMNHVIRRVGCADEVNQINPRYFQAVLRACDLLMKKPSIGEGLFYDLDEQPAA
jgi:hypothetical protein